MDIKDSIFISAADYLKQEVLRGLGVRLWNGRYVDEWQTGWLPSSREGMKAPIRVAVSLQAPAYGFQPGDRAGVDVKNGYGIDVPKPIDLHDVSLDEFRAWLGEVKAEAQRWS